MSQTQNLGVVSVLGKGIWGAGQSYPKLSIVRSGNSSYLAYRANSNIQPGVTIGWESYWMLLAQDPSLTQSDISEIIRDLSSEIKTTDAYQKGYTDGQSAGFSLGQKAEYNSFWDTYQNNGTRRNYSYAFSYDWDDVCYNPKYDIECEGSGASNLFAYNQQITDTTKDGRITITFGTSATYTFNWCKALKKAHIIVNEATTFSYTFNNCTSLTDLIVGGTIGQNGFDVSSCPLTMDSIDYIAVALQEKSGGDWVVKLGSRNIGVALSDSLQTITEKGWRYE